MTKKDYKLIASVLWWYGIDLAENGTYTDLVHEFARVLAKTNTRFDRDKFLKACGVRV